MSKTAAFLEKAIRSEFVAQGCKKVGHIEFISSEDKVTLFSFFTMVVGTERRVETQIDVRYRILNEFAFYISEYGTDYKGHTLRGKFPGRVPIPNSLQVSGVASLSLFGVGETRVFDGTDVEQFVERCIEQGRKLVETYSHIESALSGSLKASPPPDYQIIVNLFLEDFDQARRVIEEQREDDGVFLSLVPAKADEYLHDIGL